MTIVIDEAVLQLVQDVVVLFLWTFGAIFVLMLLVLFAGPPLLDWAERRRRRRAQRGQARPTVTVRHLP